MQPGFDGGRTCSEGLADLTLAVRAGRTRLVRSLTRPPLVVQRALYLDDAVPDMASIYLANPTAGVFQRDVLQVMVRVCAGARAHVTTQAATKLYAMPDGAARQDTRLLVEEGAFLEYLPDPVIPYRGARFSQVTAVTVAPGATLVWGDILVPGRIASGEFLAFEDYQSRTTVLDAFRHPLYHEAFALTPSKRSPQRLGVLGRGRAAVLGTLLVVSDQIAAMSLRDGIREALTALQAVRTGVSVLPGGNGIGLKAMAEDVAPVRSALRIAWAEARRQCLGVDLPLQRKY